MQSSYSHDGVKRQSDSHTPYLLEIRLFRGDSPIRSIHATNLEFEPDADMKRKFIYCTGGGVSGLHTNMRR